MDELTLRMNFVGLEKVPDPCSELILFKDRIEKVLINPARYSEPELIELLRYIEQFNSLLKQKINFDPHVYSDNPLLQNIVRKCNEFYIATFEGSIRYRLLQSLNFYNHILIFA